MHFIFIFLVFVSLVVAAVPAVSQSPSENLGGLLDEPSVTRSTYGDWQRLCVMQTAIPTCEISQTLQVEKDGQSNIAMRITLNKSADAVIMEVALPLGIDLSGGIALQVDEINEINVPFSTCLVQGCAALFTVEKEFLTQLRNGSTLKVAFRPFAQTKSVILNSSLRGFTNAIKVLKQ
tara:strand:- start:450 stop:983 length:534 start_codon:yes stop_codon:yes gene_type:complete